VSTIDNGILILRVSEGFDKSISRCQRNPLASGVRLRISHIRSFEKVA